MLTNCQTCQYYDSDMCAVNAQYWERYTLLDSRLSNSDRAQIETELSPCNDWEQSPALKPITAELTLTLDQWQSLTKVIIEQGLPPEVLKNVQEQIPEREVLMIPVESSNIAAIGFNDGNLFVEFISGSRYRYDDVPSETFQEFLEAPSKGRYLNAEIKGPLSMNRLNGRKASPSMQLRLSSSQRLREIDAKRGKSI